MGKSNHVDLTAKNLDRLVEFLGEELTRPTLSAQIPDGTHIFHGSYRDSALTQANLKLASKILLGMTLGYVEDAPLMMIFEQKPGERTLIDLSEGLEKRKAKRWVERFQEQSQQDVADKINTLLTVGEDAKN